MALSLSKVAAPQRAIRKASRNVRAAAAADRPVWFPGNAPPAHLNGTLAGDYGFDPLSLGQETETLRWYVQAELVHCRTAMTAVAGILFPAIATKAGALNVPEWYDAGKIAQDNSAIPFGTLVIVQLLLCGWAETKRWQDFVNPGSQADGSFLGVTDPFKGKENGYPGGKFFDPFAMAEGDAATYARYKEAEVKNGRLAMVALVGFVFQHEATGKGPIDNLADHLANPYGVTFATNGVSVPVWHP